VAHLDSLVVLDAAGKSGAALTFGFERAGYKVYATRDPEDALAMAKTRVPQLMVVAVDGPDALSFVGRLREDAPTRELPVVAIGEPGRREEALRAGTDEFVQRPAFIRDILTLSRLAVAVRQDGDDGGVVGLLEDYGLYFLVRALAVAGRSCVLELERGRRIGEVQVAKGAVVGAKVGRMSGMAAFHHLLLWGEASLSLRFESPTAERRIAANVDELLEAGRAFAKEFETVSARVGGAQAVYAHEPRRAAEARAQIPAEVMVLVKQYDGRKPLIDIVEDSPFKPFDTIKITYRLAQLGAIAKCETRESAPLTERLAVRDWLLGDAEAKPAERPKNGSPGGVTEAGRRAAEAYAAEMARREAQTSPADDILDDTAVLRKALSEATMTPGPPVKPIAKAEPAAQQPKPAPQPKPAEKAEPAPQPKPAAKAEPAPQPKPVAKPVPQPAAKPASTAAKAEPRPASKAEPPSKKKKAKLSPQAAAAAPPKESHTHFDAVDEEFFARESDLWHVPVDTFDDLDPASAHKKKKKK
jgi:CheY-like chemotaxis protein